MKEKVKLDFSSLARIIVFFFFAPILSHSSHAPLRCRSPSLSVSRIIIFVPSHRWKVFTDFSFFFLGKK